VFGALKKNDVGVIGALWHALRMRGLV
jgi:hypothetical protein